MRHHLCEVLLALSLASPAAAQTNWPVSLDVGGPASIDGAQDRDASAILILPATIDVRGDGDVFGGSLTWPQGPGHGVGVQEDGCAGASQTRCAASRGRVGAALTLPSVTTSTRRSVWGVDFGYRGGRSQFGLHPPVWDAIGLLSASGTGGTRGSGVFDVRVPMPGLSIRRTRQCPPSRWPMAESGRSTCAPR